MKSLILEMRKIFYSGILLFLFSCSTTGKSSKTYSKSSQNFELTEISSDPSYGLSEKNPVQVGGVDQMKGPFNQAQYLKALAGPNGEPISFYRAGSCCPIKSKNDPFGTGSVMLDNYRVTWEGATDTVSIYINMYDYGPLKAPVGFTIKK